VTAEGTLAAPRPDEPLPTVPLAPAAPLAGAARVPALDALRGLALLGVLAVNVPIMLGPEEAVFALPWAVSPAPRSLAAIHVLFAGKAYALLAFLFGAGLALQAARLGPRAAEVLPRRLRALALVGAAHGLLLWYGDILATYATVGAVWFLLLRERSPAARARWAAALFLVIPVLAGAVGGALALVQAVAPEALARPADSAVAEVTRDAARAVEVYGRGTVGAIFAFRGRAFVQTYLSGFAFMPQFLALFLAGGWAVERGVLERPGEHRRLLGRVAALGVLLGGAGEVAYAALVSGGVGSFGRVVLGHGIHAASAPALSLGTTAALLLLWEHGRARLLLLLAPLGRLSLSAYLSQSLLFTTVAYAYAGGRYGMLAPDACLALAAATWLAQAALAPVYLSRFELGPAEWLWRRLTYRT
jgi:uncharacterized protein